ncbi:MAG: 6-carboxytetrahydropterin synthase [Betaproteobacteria bacterium]|nr:6-carboxytetrahydropterin synthase [Betaproteobacteria bacterium]
MTAPTVELSLAFGFDAAHRFECFPDGHPNRRMHGHSFQVEVAVRGTPDPATGFVMEFSRLEAACGDLRSALDHHVLNEIDGLEQPSLERLSVWIWDQLAGRIARLTQVTVRRDSRGQSCSYRGPG